MKIRSTLLVILFLLILSACNSPISDTKNDIANPASVYCNEQGYKLDIRNNSDGSQYGVCVFNDTSECDEWKYYRGECKPK